jgi:uncharacterized protein YndB with AHSA1/START domain
MQILDRAIAERSVASSVSVATRRAEYWRFLTEPPLLREWFADSIPIAATGGATVDLHFGDGDFFCVKITGAEEPGRLCWTWQFMGIGSCSKIEFRLTEEDGGTLIDVRDCGWYSESGVHELEAGWATSYPDSANVSRPERMRVICGAKRSARRSYFRPIRKANCRLVAILPLRRRLDSWLAGFGEPHKYMTYIGAGWAVARIPWHRVKAERRARRLHRFWWPLVIDGFGFHQGYFSAANLAEVSQPKCLDSYSALCAYDQGLGRSFWFVCGADPWKIAELIGQYAESRHWDLWSGAGLACAYAGGVSAEETQILRRIAGIYAAGAAQGACFAAKARMRAGNPAAHTDMACMVLCGMSALESVLLADQIYAMIVDLGGTYRDWCKLLRSKLESVSIAGAKYS